MLSAFFFQAFANNFTFIFIFTSYICLNYHFPLHDMIRASLRFGKKTELLDPRKLSKFYRYFSNRSEALDMIPQNLPMLLINISDKYSPHLLHPERGEWEGLKHSPAYGIFIAQIDDSSTSHKSERIIHLHHLRHVGTDRTVRLTGGFYGDINWENEEQCKNARNGDTII